MRDSLARSLGAFSLVLLFGCGDGDEILGARIAPDGTILPEPAGRSCGFEGAKQCARGEAASYLLQCLRGVWALSSGEACVTRSTVGPTLALDHIYNVALFSSSGASRLEFGQGSVKVAPLDEGESFDHGPFCWSPSGKRAVWLRCSNGNSECSLVYAEAPAYSPEELGVRVGVDEADGLLWLGEERVIIARGAIPSHAGLVVSLVRPEDSIPFDAGRVLVHRPAAALVATDDQLTWVGAEGAPVPLSAALPISWTLSTSGRTLAAVHEATSGSAAAPDELEAQPLLPEGYAFVRVNVGEAINASPSYCFINDPSSSQCPADPTRFVFEGFEESDDGRELLIGFGELSRAASAWVGHKAYVSPITAEIDLVDSMDSGGVLLAGISGFSPLDATDLRQQGGAVALHLSKLGDDESTHWLVREWTTGGTIAGSWQAAPLEGRLRNVEVSADGAWAVADGLGADDTEEVWLLQRGTEKPVRLATPNRRVASVAARPSSGHQFLVSLDEECQRMTQSDLNLAICDRSTFEYALVDPDSCCTPWLALDGIVEPVWLSDGAGLLAREGSRLVFIPAGKPTRRIVLAEGDFMFNVPSSWISFGR